MFLFRALRMVEEVFLIKFFLSFGANSQGYPWITADLYEIFASLIFYLKYEHKERWLFQAPLRNSCLEPFWICRKMETIL